MAIKCDITDIHYSSDRGWHVDILPHGSIYAFIVSAPNPDYGFNDEWYKTLKEILNVENTP